MTKTKKTVEKKRGDTIKLVVKSNKLVEAKYMFNIWETRFFLTLVTMIDKEDADDKVYRVWYRDIKNNFNINSNKSYHFLRKAAKSIHKKDVEIGWMDGDVNRGRAYRLFKFVDYLKEEQKQGVNVKKHEYVDVKIDEEMLPFLLHVKKQFDQVLPISGEEKTKVIPFTSYDLRNIEKLKTYGIRMYELLKQFEFKGFRTIRVDDLKDKFLITDEYPRFSSFNQSVIMPSIKAINKYTDINIPINRIVKTKKGRRVDALRFVIESKTEKELSKIRGEYTSNDEKKSKPKKVIEKKENPLEKVNELFSEFEATIVQSFGVTPSVFLKMLSTNKYNKKAIEQAINVTRRAKYNQEITKNVAGYFIKALKEGFTDAKEEAKKAEERKKQNIQTIKILEQDILELEASRAKKVNNRIRELINKDSTIAETAITAIKNNPMLGSLIKTKERKLNRALDVEDYRKDEGLRKLVINNIVLLKQDEFNDIFAKYNPQIEALQENINLLK